MENASWENIHAKQLFNACDGMKRPCQQHVSSSSSSRRSNIKETLYFIQHQSLLLPVSVREKNGHLLCSSIMFNTWIKITREDKVGNICQDWAEDSEGVKAQPSDELNILGSVKSYLHRHRVRPPPDVDRVQPSVGQAPHTAPQHLCRSAATQLISHLQLIFIQMRRSLTEHFLLYKHIHGWGKWLLSNSESWYILKQWS